MEDPTNKASLNTYHLACTSRLVSRESGHWAVVSLSCMGEWSNNVCPRVLSIHRLYRIHDWSHLGQGDMVQLCCVFSEETHELICRSLNFEVWILDWHMIGDFQMNSSAEFTCIL